VKHEKVYRELAQEFVEMFGHTQLGFEIFLVASDMAQEIRSGDSPAKLAKAVWRKIAERNQQRLHRHMVAKRGSYYFFEFEASALAEVLPDHVSNSWRAVNLLLLMDLTKTLPPEWHMSIRRNIIVTPSPKAIINGWLNWHDEVKSVDPQAAKDMIQQRLYVEGMSRVLSMIPPQFDRGSATTTDGTPISAAVDAYGADLLERLDRG
jgi:hypothetical protein